MDLWPGKIMQGEKECHVSPSFFRRLKKAAYTLDLAGWDMRQACTLIRQIFGICLVRRTQYSYGSASIRVHILGTSDKTQMRFHAAMDFHHDLS